MNEYVAAVVDELYELGIREVVLSPGSRSTPLSMLFCEYSKYKVFLNIDERSAAFFALGIAKEHQRPVVLVCTSGSAAAHYLPAVIEAKYSRIPLMILTADRPPELQNVGAPQTINQNRLFGAFTNYYEELAIPDTQNQYTYPRVVMQKAYLKCCKTPNGPVHINIPIREPLVPEMNKEYFQYGKKLRPYQFSVGLVQVDYNLTHIHEKKGIIVCGADPLCACLKEIIELGERLKSPILADPLSNLRSCSCDAIIDSYDAFLKDSTVREMLRPDYILLFGQTPISKRLQQFIAQSENVECYQIDEAAEYRNPSLLTTQYIQTNTKIFIQRIKCCNEDSGYLKLWQSQQRKMRTKLETVLNEEILFEGKIVRMLQNMMPYDSRLVVANSMSIRDVDYFWKAKEQAVKILCNRGTNGIDGTISTALGVSTSGRPTILITGDLAFFHDLNGLLIGKTHALNLVIILLNNDGGGIFQYLPQKGKKHFEYLFTTSHGMDFQAVQKLYRVVYHKTDSYIDFEQNFLDSIEKTGITIIEVNTDRERSQKLHEKYTSP